jgi:hypothetical protein
VRTISNVARALDKIEPGWAERIDTEELAKDCVLGQLYGNYFATPPAAFAALHAAAPPGAFANNIYRAEWKSEIRWRKQQGLKAELDRLEHKHGFAHRLRRLRDKVAARTVLSEMEQTEQIETREVVHV